MIIARKHSIYFRPIQTIFRFNELLSDQFCKKYLFVDSGLSSTTERGVTPVYLRCREGTVSWVYPRGALRLLFRPSLPADEREFRVCVRVIRRPDPPDLFHTQRLNDTGRSSFYFNCKAYDSPSTAFQCVYHTLILVRRM